MLTNKRIILKCCQNILISV